MLPNRQPVDLSRVTFLDLEADRGQRPLLLGAVRGDRSVRIDLDAGSPSALAAQLTELGEGPLAGHNLTRFDLPLLAAWGFRPLPRASPLIDTLFLSMLADPSRPSHALDKTDGPQRGGLPDPIEDARRARALLLECEPALVQIETEVAALYAALLDQGGQPGFRWLRACAGAPLPDLNLEQSVAALPAELTNRFCRARLSALLQSLDPTVPEQYVALALALRFIEKHSRQVQYFDLEHGSLKIHNNLFLD